MYHGYRKRGIALKNIHEANSIEEYLSLCDQSNFNIIQSETPCQPIKLHDSKRMIKRKIERFLKYDGKGGLIRPRIQVGKDQDISIQASFFNYCYPKINNAKKYKQVEVGFPSFEFSKRFERQYRDETAHIYPYTDVEPLFKEIHKYVKAQKHKYVKRKSIA